MRTRTLRIDDDDDDDHVVDDNDDDDVDNDADDNNVDDNGSFTLSSFGCSFLLPFICFWVRNISLVFLIDKF